MKLARAAAYWALPSLFCIWFYWYGLKSWFQADDFAWLGLTLEVHDGPSLANALFSPRAQGTIRPWSERAFFLGFHALFGLDALPFRIWVFLTQVANVVLLTSIARRLTRSAAAGFLAAVFWIVNSTLAQVMSWTCVYNQALVAFFLLLAFHFLLRFIDTGRRRYEVWQWVVFLLGFGAQELNLVYPALAAGYTFFCARHYFRRTLALVPVSVGYAALHMWLAPAPAAGLYAMHFDASVFGTLLTYWSWTLGPVWLISRWNVPIAWVVAGVAVVSAALLGFVVWRARRRDWLPLFFCYWFVAVLAPVLPLRDHVTEYYPYVPSMGIAMLGGAAFVAAWRRPLPVKAAAAALAMAYMMLVAPQARAQTRYFFERGRRVRNLVQGVARATELHAGKVILLDRVDDELFWTAIVDRPFRLLPATVFLTPGSGQRVTARPDSGDVNRFVLPPEAAAHALANGSAVVYRAGGERLVNVTKLYRILLHREGQTAAPRRVDASNPVLEYLLGPTWYAAEKNLRWMPERATVRLGGPRTTAEKLWVRGICPPQSTRTGPLDVTISVDGMPLEPARIEAGRQEIARAFDLPPELAGRPSVEVTVEVPRTASAPGDSRKLGLAFGVFEIR